jgi:hypothetical protein
LAWFISAMILSAQAAAAGTIFSSRQDIGNWSLWTHYAGGEDADKTVATTPPPPSDRPSISLACRDDMPIEGVVTVRIDPLQRPKPSVPITIEFGKDNGAPMHFTAPIETHGSARILGLGAVLEIALQLRTARRVTITIDDAMASFDVSGFQGIERDFLQICTMTH